jgi:hypothetical protein
MTTKLDAVNMCLRQIGQRKVSSLTVGLNVVSDAIACIDEISTTVQSDEWGFNFEENYPLSLNTDGTISAPTSAIEISCNRFNFDIEVLGGKLYDKNKHTFIFTKPLKADIRWLRCWEDLPAAAQYYIAVRAARYFTTLRQTDQKTADLTARDESEALRILLRVDTDDDPSALKSPDMWWVDQYQL